MNYILNKLHNKSQLNNIQPRITIIFIISITSLFYVKFRLIKRRLLILIFQRMLRKNSNKNNILVTVIFYERHKRTLNCTRCYY
jgi:hypothetical protein